MCMPVGQQSGFHFLLDVRWLTRPIRPHADPIRRPCSALRQLVIQEAKLDRASVEALRPLGALTALCLPRCELLSLPLRALPRGTPQVRWALTRMLHALHPCAFPTQQAARRLRCDEGRLHTLQPSNATPATLELPPLQPPA